MSGTFVKVAIVLSAFTVINCSSSKKEKDSSSDGANPSSPIASLAPTSISVSIDMPLEYYSVDLTTVIVPSETSSVASGVGTAPTTGIAASGSGIATSGVGLSSGLGGAFTGSGFTAVNAGPGFSATATVSASFPMGAIGACSLLSPFTLASCLISGFTITGANLSASGSFIVRVYATNGGASDYLDATAIPVRRKVIERFMDATIPGAFLDSAFYGTDLSVTVGGKMYFIAKTSNNVSKVFVSDGVSITQLPNTCGDSLCDDAPLYLTAFNNKVYFFAADSSAAVRLFVTDGFTTNQVSYTAQTTTFSDFGAGVVASQYRPVVAHNKLYVSLINSSFVRKLYSIDTFGVLSQVSDIRGSNTLTDLPNYFSVYGDDLYFAATNSDGFRKLFKSDGTAITQISNTRGSATLTDGPRMLYTASDGVYFWAFDSNNKNRIFKTDGSAVNMVSNINPGGDLALQGLYDGMFAHLGTKFIFNANNLNTFQKLFSADGVSATQLTNGAGNQSTWDNNWGMYKLGTEIFFAGTYLSGMKLFKSDGSTVTMVSNTSGSSTTDYPNILGVFDNDLYFTANNPAGFVKLYKTNGSSVSQVMDLNPGNHDFDTTENACGGSVPVFYLSGSHAYISTFYDFANCKEALFRISSI